MRYTGILLTLAFLLSAISAKASDEGLNAQDPMIKICSQPIDKNVDEVLAAISKDVSRDTGIEQQYITYYWVTLDAVNWNGEKQAGRPILVDLYPAGFFDNKTIQSVMKSLAAAIEKHVGLDREWVFIATHFPNQGQVYISGDIEIYDDYKGPENEAEYAVKEDKDPMRAMLPFEDAAFEFQSLWRFGVIASGGADFGEALTAASGVTDGDHDSWYDPWFSMAQHVEGNAQEYLQAGHRISAQEAFFRATNYYRAAAIYLDPKDPRMLNTWQKGRDSFLEAAKLSDGLIEYTEIPYEDTTLPAYFCKVDKSGKKRPLLLIQTGLDGTAEDLYFILVPQALKRGYNCLVFEGPGQGEMIISKKLPFRYDWEAVVTPVVDHALKLPETDPKKMALIAYSMGGYLGPRAMAFDHRVPYCVVDGGVFSVFDGVMTKFPEEVPERLDDDAAEEDINQIVSKEREEHPDVDQFIEQMLWTFQEDSAFHLFRKLKAFSMGDCIDKLKCEMLVLGSVHDQVAGSYEQAKIFYNALEVPKKTYDEFSIAEGAQFHCQSGAPMVSSERILNWLDDKLQKKDNKNDDR